LPLQLRSLRSLRPSDGLLFLTTESVSNLYREATGR